MQYNKKSVEDIDVNGKKVIVRCDFNVPQDENGNITDDKRIRASLETIKYLLDHNAAVILCSHLGRPKGEVNMKYSLAPVAERLSELLGQEVKRWHRRVSILSRKRLFMAAPTICWRIRCLSTALRPPLSMRTA